MASVFTINQKIESLRAEMLKNNIDAFIIPSSDAHQGEYVADRWNSRTWISGFTGSAGIVVITNDKAGLWTDARYFLQAEQELQGSEIELHRPNDRFAPEYVTWLADNLKSGSVVGIDGNLCTIGQYGQYFQILEDSNIKLETSIDLIEKIWSDRPAIPKNKIFELDIAYAGISRLDKLDNLKEEMTNLGVDHHLITTLDDIAWIFNIRGNDVAFNPIALAYAIISHEQTILFIDAHKIPDTLVSKFESEGITIKKYDSIVSELNNLDADSIIFIDKTKCNYNIYRAINNTIQTGSTISTIMKSIKNEIELSNVRKIMEEDGAAIAKTFYWLEQNMKKENKTIEVDVAKRLIQHRSEIDGYKGESFPAIVGYKGNGAIIHYHAMPETCAEIKPDGILLVDSGGQFLSGTTDITRTITMGKPSKEEKTNFTLVLKGHIALAKVIFPKGTSGGQLDVLARMHLWKNGLNYGHGTGHGVGSFLNVHEGPQSISSAISSNKTAIEAGMITSNEPGYYKKSAYGIRIENLILAIESPQDDFLEFETITIYPLDIQLIDTSILSPLEIKWINDFQKESYSRISPHLDGSILRWFETKCHPLE